MDIDICSTSGLWCYQEYPKIVNADCLATETSYCCVASSVGGGSLPQFDCMVLGSRSCFEACLSSYHLADLISSRDRAIVPLLHSCYSHAFYWAKLLAEACYFLYFRRIAQLSNMTLVIRLTYWFPCLNCWTCILSCYSLHNGQPADFHNRQKRSSTWN